MITANRLHKFVANLPSPVCAVCSKALSDQKYHADITEPKEVESGEGLPDVYRFRVDAFVNAAGTATVVMHNDTTGDCVDYEDYAELQSELKASLLREKELRELLIEVIENPYITHRLKERIDAAVTGE